VTCCGRLLRSGAVGFLLLLALSSPCFSQDVGEMTDQEIVDELTSIIERQATRLTELETILASQQRTLISLQLKLTELSQSSTRLRTAMNELNNYSRSLEDEVRSLTIQRRALVWGLLISTAAAVVGFLL